jgi:hypothetical protein
MVYVQEELCRCVVSKSRSVFDKGFLFLRSELYFHDVFCTLSSFIGQVVSIAYCGAFSSLYVFLDDTVVLQCCHCGVNVDAEWPVFIFFEGKERTVVHFSIQEE